MKKLITVTILVSLLMMTVSSVLVVSAQEGTAEPTEELTVEPTEEPTAEPTEEPTEEPTVEPTEEPTVEPTEEPTEEPTLEPTEEPTVEPTEEPTEEPTVEATATVTPTVELTGEEVEAAGALPGNFTTQVVAIANLETSGSSEAPALTLYDIDSDNEISVSGIPAAYPGGVVFVTDSQFSDGRYAGLVQSGFTAEAAVLTVNATAKTADTYTGFDSSAVAQTLYGPIIYNKHYGWESTLVCQNAGTVTDTIRALLFQRGVTGSYEDGAMHRLSASVGENESVVWDIADDPAVQADWPGGNEKFGYVRFYSVSGNDIACIVDSQNMSSPHVESIYNAVPTSYAATELNIPLVYNGHGSSSSSNRATKINSGFAIVNPGSSTVQATVRFTAKNGYTVDCTQSVGGGSSVNWYTPLVWANGDNGAWSCDQAFPLTYVYDQTSFGSAKLTATGGNLLGITNHAQFDAGLPLGQGFCSLGVPTSKATNRVICPLAFNKNPSSDWVTGVRVANVASSGSITVTWRLVRAGVDPTVPGNYATIEKSIDAGAGKSTYFPMESGALTNFEGAVFVEAADPSDQILSTSVNSNFGTAINAVGMYDCINY